MKYQLPDKNIYFSRESLIQELRRREWARELIRREEERRKDYA